MGAECLSKLCTVRGLFVGSRDMFEAMNRAIEVNDIKPVIDKKVFKLGELREAYQYMVSSLCIYSLAGASLA